MDNAIRIGVLIDKDGKFLLGQEATEVIYGLWNWQQGKVEEGEDLEAAALREVKEEIGLDIRLIRKLTVLKNPFPGTREIHVYLGEILGGELSFSKDEILDLKWFTEEEILSMRDRLSGPWLPKVINLLK